MPLVSSLLFSILCFCSLHKACARRLKRVSIRARRLGWSSGFPCFLSGSPFTFWQGWVIRTSETFNTVKYALNTQYAVPYCLQFGSADFWPIMDPIRPKFTQNVPDTFPIYLLSIYYIITLKLTERRLLGRKLPKDQKMANLQSYNTAQLVQYVKIRVKYHTAYYTNTPYDPSLVFGVDAPFPPCNSPAYNEP